MAEPENPTENTPDAGAATDKPERQEFKLHKVYLKDVSFESPQSPKIFATEKNWKPEVALQLNTEVRELENNIIENTLNVQVTVKTGDEVVYLVEVKQAGLFHMKGFDDRNKAGMLNVFCPNLLFPFAREAIASLVAKGGFPQLLLEPVNFEALYAQHLQKAKQNAPAPDTAQ